MIENLWIPRPPPGPTITYCRACGTFPVPSSSVSPCWSGLEWWVYRVVSAKPASPPWCPTCVLGRSFTSCWQLELILLPVTVLNPKEPRAHGLFLAVEGVFQLELKLEGKDE